MNRSLIGLGALLALTACGGGDSAPKPQKSTTGSTSSSTAETTTTAKSTDTGGAAKASGSQDWNDSMGTATVSGAIKFEGVAPENKAITMSDVDPKCPGGAEETILVSNGGLANVVISVNKGLDGYKFAKGTGAVNLDQKGCQYIPHVLAMQAGQTVSITNSDDTVHNVHSYSKRNQAFNQAQPAGAGAIEKKMSQKDKSFPIKCDMHAWMNCQVVVFDHPFFTVSDENGNFTLPKLPAGTYKLVAEHESLGKQEAEVTVADGGTETVTFSYGQSAP